MVSPAAGSLPKGNTASTGETLTHILYVDNEAGLLKAAKPILEMQGSFHVETASSVEEAMKKMEAKTFDAIVCDYIMPGKDGLEFLKELRDSGNRIPFIIFTGKGREIVAIAALNLGADQYVNKIGKTEAVYSELAHGIRTVVKGKKAEEALRDSEKEKSAVLDSMSELVSHQDLKHRILWVNKKAADSVNMKAEQLKGRYCHELWAKSAKPCAACPLEDTMKTGQPQQGEITTPDGRIWSISGYPIKDVNGNTTSIVEVTTEITEHKKAEEKLRESEGKFRNLAEKSPNMIFINKKGRVFYANKRCEEVMGYRRKEFYSPNFNFFTLIATKSTEQLKAKYSRHLKGEEIRPYECTLITKEGKRIEAILTSKLITYEGETAILGIITDITKRKKMEKQLKESEEKYRKQFEAALDAIILADAETGIIVDCNRAATELVGRKKSELVGQHQRILHPPEAIEGGFSRTFEQHRKEKKPQVLEDQIITKNGEIRDVIINATTFELEDRNLLQGTFHDITERKKTNEKLKASEKRFRAIIDSAQNPMILVCEEGKIAYWNNAAEKTFGYTKKEAIGKELHKFLAPERFYEDYCRGFGKFTKTGQGDAVGKTLELMAIKKDGTEISIELSLSALKLKGKWCAIGIVRDITERKEAEKKLDNIMNELVAINEKLGVVGKLTRHDARNKLSIIANNVYLAKQKLAADHGALEFLGDVESAIDQMEKIFDFARNYEMLGVEELVYMDVGKSAEEAAILLSGMNDVKLVNECKGLMVMADSLLRQLFYNLIDNTLKHGEKVSQIRVYYEEGEDQLKLVYEDDGVGIPENEKEKLFKEGYGKSTGYGLYLIKKTCEEYGWIVRETGKQGKGAQFTITIPKTTKNGKKSYRIN